MSARQFDKAYISGLTLMFSFILTWHFCHLSLLETSIFSVKIRAGLSSLLFNKVSTLTNFTIKSETGVIINLLSNDLEVFSYGMFAFFMILSLPVAILGNITILIIFVGWTGILGVLVAMILLLISSRVSEWNGETVYQANEFKDQRVNIIS